MDSNNYVGIQKLLMYWLRKSKHQLNINYDYATFASAIFDSPYTFLEALTSMGDEP